MVLLLLVVAEVVVIAVIVVQVPITLKGIKQRDYILLIKQFILCVLYIFLIFINCNFTS